jgi:hypothetical protein
MNNFYQEHLINNSRPDMYRSDETEIEQYYFLTMQALLEQRDFEIHIGDLHANENFVNSLNGEMELAISDYRCFEFIKNDRIITGITIYDIERNFHVRFDNLTL